MFHTLIVLLYLFISCNKSLDVQMIGLLKTSLTFILISDMASPMRVHAVGPTNPNIDPHYGRIPALDQKRIIWDGIPRPDFEEVFFEYLMHGLGTISENGYTLLTTAFGNDAGGFGPLANPNAAGDKASQRRVTASNPSAVSCNPRARAHLQDASKMLDKCNAYSTG